MAATWRPVLRAQPTHRLAARRGARDCYQIDAAEVRLAGGQKAVVFNHHPEPSLAVRQYEVDRIRIARGGEPALTC
jgi:hypothetical protein